MNKLSPFFTIEGNHCLDCNSENIKWNNIEGDAYCFNCGKWQEEIELDFDYETRLIEEVYYDVLKEEMEWNK